MPSRRENLKIGPTVSRRKLLLGATAAAVGSTLSGCRAAAADALKVALLEGSVPAEVLKKFQQQVAEPVTFQWLARPSVQFQTSGQLSELFLQLQRWQDKQKSSFSLRQLLPWVKEPAEQKPDNLVSLGDYWLTSAIAQNLIDPLQLPPDTLEKLPLSWQQFVTRGAKGQLAQLGSSTDTLWAAPYKVQSLVVVYRQDKVLQTTNTQPFSSWRNLLDPVLQGRIALPDHPRIVLGLLQKMQSDSFNIAIESATGKPTVNSIRQQLAQQLSNLFSQLDRQVKTYDSTNSLKALINEDVDVAVSWSADVVAAQQRYRNLKMTIPTEGSLLSADMWVRPKGADLSEAAQAWIDYCWEAESAIQISLSGKGLSPVFLPDDADVPKVLTNKELAIDAMRNSELLLPLSAEAEIAYFEFWQQMRAV